MTKYWDEVPLAPSPTFIDFDLDTGIIKSIGAEKVSDHSIEVEYSKVKDLIDGKVYFKHFLVQFNPVSTMYELINKHDEKTFQYNINNSLYCLPKTSTADIIVVKDYTNKCWKLTYGKLFAKTLKQNSVKLQTTKHFSVVKKNDPYVLHRSLSFNLASNDLTLQFNDNDAIIYEYDIYTNKLFNSYGVVSKDD